MERYAAERTKITDGAANIDVQIPKLATRRSVVISTSSPNVENNV